MDLSELRNLDTSDFANWPLPIKLGASAIVLAAVVAAGWYLDWQKKAQALEKVAKVEISLRQDFETKQKRAANLEAYQQQLAEMQASFGAMVRQLPSRAEVSKLLVDISQTGLANGLEFELFKPESEIKRDFYSELPVKIKAKGNYHQLARFVSGVTSLPRIVTLHDISITTPNSDKSSKGEAVGSLVMELTAKTYWYLDETGAAK